MTALRLQRSLAAPSQWGASAARPARSPTCPQTMRSSICFHTGKCNSIALLLIKHVPQKSPKGAGMLSKKLS